MSDYLYRLEVPEDKRSFTVAEALEATCCAIHPDIVGDEQPVMILSISKAGVSPFSPGLMGRPEALKEADWNILSGIWSSLGEPEFPMTAAKWQTYRDAFNLSQSKPEGWLLTPLQRDPEIQRSLMREVAAQDHRENLKRAVNAGAITLRNPVTGLVSELGWIGNADKWLLTRKQFMTFCDLLSIELLDAPSPSAAVALASEGPIPAAPSAPNEAAAAEPSHAGNSAGTLSAVLSHGKRWTAERRAKLLKEFRVIGGKRPGEAGKTGKWGALAELVRKTGIDKDTAANQLDKAIEEKKAADMWKQLNDRR